MRDSLALLRPPFDDRVEAVGFDGMGLPMTSGFMQLATVIVAWLLMAFRTPVKSACRC